MNPQGASPHRSPDPIFIDFEGIDGSGKTTLSNRLAEYLNQKGIPVHHARDQGIFRSKISRAIRELTRDPTLLRMTNVTEFLLYVARDAQMIEEYIRPKLKPGHVVFSDRYLYSAITQCHHARGIDRESVNSVIQLAARGLWPDLVVYCDVDTLTSRVRKKIQKIREHRLGDFGRKGLMGIGFREQMRKGFFDLARESPDSWIVIDNATSTIEESLQLIFVRVNEVLKSKGYPQVPDPGWADLRAVAERRRRPTEIRARVEETLSIPDASQRQERAVEVFFNHIRGLLEKHGAYAALFISGFDTHQAHEIRERLLKSQPALIAYGLQGMSSDASMNFRDRLKEIEPMYVARSLAGMPLDPRAIAMREALADAAPEHVAMALRGNDTEPAWELRERLRKKATYEVLLSLQSIDSERAWTLREKKAKRSYYPALLQSLAGIDSDRAWEWRNSLADEYMPWVLLSLRGLLSDRAWEWRRNYVELAPKIIVKTIGRSEDPRAWELRHAAKEYAKEVLDSIGGIDSGMAWELRQELADRWPNTSVSSLGAGNQSERAWNFRWEQLRLNPENLLLLKHVAKAGTRSQELSLEDDSLDDDDEGEFA